MLQLSPFGTQNWVQMFGTTGTDSAASLWVGPNDDIYVTGYTDGSGEFGVPLGGRDAFLLRISPSGATIWERRFGGPGNDYGIAVTLDPFGNVFVAGATDGALGSGLSGSFGGLDAFAAKFSPSGALQ